MERLGEENRELTALVLETRGKAHSLESQLDVLQSRSESLEKEATRAATLRRKRAVLESTVSELTGNVEELQQGFESAQRESASKTEELRELLIEQFGGIAVRFGWKDCIALVAQKGTELKKVSAELEAANQSLQRLEQANRLLAEKNAELIAAEPKVIVEKERDPFANVNRFRHLLAKRMARVFFKVTDAVASISEIVRGKEEICQFRPLILSVILANRWKSFKKTEHLDPNGVLDYAIPQSRDETSRAEDLKNRTADIVNQAQRELAKNETLTRSNEELDQKVSQLDKDLNQARRDLQTMVTESRKLKSRLEESEEKCRRMVDRREHDDLQRQLEQTVADRQTIERELGSMKKEMQNMIDSLSTGEVAVGDLQLQIVALTEENERFRQEIASLAHELTIAHAALKERTKELLALERELVKQKTQVAVVRDPTPFATRATGDANPLFRNPFWPESVRDGLSKMQDKLMRPTSGV
jgi:chromosome segregation ATPase